MNERDERGEMEEMLRSTVAMFDPDGVDLNLGLVDRQRCGSFTGDDQGTRLAAYDLVVRFRGGRPADVGRRIRELWEREGWDVREDGTTVRGSAGQRTLQAILTVEERVTLMAATACFEPDPTFGDEREVHWL